METTKHYHFQGKKESRFSNQLRGINLVQVLIIAIDAAKLRQKTLICNYFGDVIEESFFFSVNSTGTEELCSKIKVASERTDARRIFLGAEATGHY